MASPTGEHDSWTAKRSTNRHAYLESKQQEEGLHAIEAPIDEVTHEQVISLWTVPANLK